MYEFKQISNWSSMALLLKIRYKDEILLGKLSTCIIAVVAASQPSYAPPAQASSVAYAQTASGAYAVPVGANPYASSVVAQSATGYTPNAEQQLSYGQPAYVTQSSKFVCDLVRTIVLIFYSY